MKRFNTKNNPTRQYRPKKKNINQILKRGQCGLRSLDYKRIDITQIISLKKIIQKELKLLEKKNNFGKLKLWFYMLPTNIVTRLSPETRMGKGKGPSVSRCCYIKPGQILFEISNISEVKALELMDFIKKHTSFRSQSLFKFHLDD